MSDEAPQAMHEETHSRAIDVSIEIDADAETVWRALTQGEEIARWFPLDARVRPGAGGAIWFSFGEGMEWESPITIWEPNRHLRTADLPSRVAVDYYIETREGKTILRLVHSGFAADTWEGELDSLENGWGSFLATLKLYLEQHRGEPRTVAFFRHPPLEISRDEAFGRMMAAFGIRAAGDGELAVGSRYVTDAGFEGVVAVHGRPINFSGIVENLGNAFLMLEIEGGKKRCRPAMWVSLYGDAQNQAPALQQRITQLIEETFATPS